MSPVHFFAFLNPPLARALGYAWLLYLAVALCASGYSAHQRSRAVEEYPFGCDSFGYLQMAKEIRAAAARSELPRFTLDALHPRLLIDAMRARNAPLWSWDEMVAPHAHHYFPRADHIAVQYPPGSGMLLALFPEGKAVHALNLAVIFISVATGLVFLSLAAVKRWWLGAGAVVFALQYGLGVLSWIAGYSYSINAVLAPLLLALLCVFGALAVGVNGGSRRAAWLLFCLGGAFAGLALLVRVPTFLLLPGFFFLVTAAPRGRRTAALAAFAVGVLLVGVLPLLAHQQRVAGAWYLSTYNEGDNALPTLSAVRPNIAYYFIDGLGSKGNSALVIALAGFAGMALFRRERANTVCLSARRLALAAFALWGPSTAYFLTHEIVTPYYQIPATFGTIALLMLGMFVMDISGPKPVTNAASSGGGQLWRLVLFLVALVPAGFAVERAWAVRPWKQFAPASVRTLTVPEELRDPRAWLFADMLSGTLWYYAQVPAHKLMFSNAETRAFVYRFIAARGEPQYVIEDSPTMKSILDEVTSLGGIPEARGQIDDFPYYLIRWPTGGPA